MFATIRAELEAAKAEVEKLAEEVTGEARKKIEAALAATKAEEAVIAGHVEAAVVSAKTDAAAALAKLVADIRALLGHGTP